MSSYGLVKTEEEFKELRELVWILTKSKAKEAASVVAWSDGFFKQFGLGRGYAFSALGYLTEKEKETAIIHSQNITTMTESLHEPLLKRDWAEALSRLHKVSSNHKDMMQIVWKVGCELINREQDQLTRFTLMRDFYYKMKKENILNQKAIALDYALFALCNDKVVYAKSVFQDLFLDGTQEKMGLSDYLCEAYQGMIMYLEWKKARSQIGTQENLTDLDGSIFYSSEEQNYEMKAKEFATKALARLNIVEHNDGVWDTFIEIYVEILVASDRQNEALKVLKDYSKNHPNHLNAQKFLYYLYRDHVADLSGEIIQVLKAIADLSPADPLVLEYCKLVGDASEIISRLFTLLDYPVWQDEVKPWKMMSSCLDRICVHKETGTESALEVVNECWKVREKWWPSFHFTKYTVNKESKSFTLLLQKFIVASILHSKANEFAVLARRKLRDAGYYNQMSHVLLNQDSPKSSSRKSFSPTGKTVTKTPIKGESKKS